MTEALPQSQIGPVTATLYERDEEGVQFLNEEAARVLQLRPVPTVWGRASGRPIYDRLPAISGAYNNDFYRDGNVKVFLQDRNRATGAGSLQVGRWAEDPKVLVVQSGFLSWNYGTVQVEGFAVNIESLNEGSGLQDGSYQVGYLLKYEADTSARYKEYKVENYSLAASATVYGATSAAKEFPVETAFTDELEPGWRPNDSGYAGDYNDGQSLIMDFTEPVLAQRFVLTAPSASLATAKCSLYFSDDGIIWHLDNNYWASRGLSWDITVSEIEKHRYWRLFFYDGYVEVKAVSYTGTAFYADQRRTGAVSIVEPYIDNEYEDIPGSHIMLAMIEISGSKVVRVEDYRLSQITYDKYQPVASWITSFQDESLRSYFTNVEKYAEKWMAPPTACYSIYDELLFEDTFEIGSDLDYPRLQLPELVHLEPGIYFTYDDIDLVVDGVANFWNNPTLINIPTPEITTESGIPIATQSRDTISMDRPGSQQQYSLKGKSTGLGLATNPQSWQIQGDEVTVYESSSKVEPYHVTNVGHPIDDSDLSTKAYVDSALIVNMDNGAYD